jgi:hypothetical protein
MTRAWARKVSVDEIEKDPGGYLHRVLEGETVVVFEKDQPVGRNEASGATSR